MTLFLSKTKREIQRKALVRWLRILAIFVASLSEGILRSTDQGFSWKNIGGPNATGDTRSLCAVNDNILFAEFSHAFFPGILVKVTMNIL